MKVRFVLAVAAAIAVVLLTAGPASAANATVNVTWDAIDGHALSISPNPVSIAPGDSVTVNFSGGQRLGIYAGSCSGPAITVLSNGTSATLTPSVSTTYNLQGFNSFTLEQTPCTSFTINVGTPPPAVSEAPLAAGLLGVVAVLFGAGFFVLRRRATRQAV